MLSEARPQMRVEIVNHCAHWYLLLHIWEKEDAESFAEVNKYGEANV